MDSNCSSIQLKKANFKSTQKQKPNSLYEPDIFKALINHIAEDTELRGLKNPDGDLCYFNVLFQVLKRLPEFRKEFINDPQSTLSKSEAGKTIVSINFNFVYFIDYNFC
jgi:hypothetical protein